MKLLPLLLLLACLSLGISSCDLLGDAGGDGSSMNATVDGEEWSSVPLVTTFLSVDSTFVTMTGNTGGLSASSIIIQITDYSGEGTYDLSAGQSAGFATYLPDVTSMTAYSSLADGSTGSLTITTDTDEFAEGIFSFVGGLEVDSTFITVEVTDGAFKINKP